MSLLSLPEELLSIIYSQVPENLALRHSRASKQLLHLSTRVTNLHLKKVVLKPISIHKAFEVGQGLTLLPQLKSLDISSLCLGSFSVEHITNSLTRLSELTDLNVSKNEIRQAGAEHIAALLRVHPKLASLDISGAAASFVQNLYQRLDSCAGNAIGDAGLGVMCEALSGKSTLQRLLLGDNNLTLKGMAKVRGLGLKELSLKNNSLNYIGTPSFLGSLTSVTSLDLWGTSLFARPESGYEMNGAISTLTRLRHLDLGCTRMTMAVGVLTLLRRSSNLTSLNVGCNSIVEMGAGGMSALLEGIRSNSSLTFLSLAGQKISGGLFPLLCDCVSRHPTMQSLDLHGCAKNEPDVLAVVSAAKESVSLRWFQITGSGLLVGGAYVTSDLLRQ